MSTTTRSPLIDDYLRRLARAAGRLPRSRRAELVAEIEQHLAEALGPGASQAETLNVLDRLGTPEEIVAAEAPAVADPRGTKEWAAILLLLFGGFVAGVGWLAGLVLLWSSRAWTTRDKWIGTLVVPGGLALGWLGFGLYGVSPGDAELCTVGTDGREVCTRYEADDGSLPLDLVLIGLLVVAPFVTAVYLARRARAA